MTPVTKALENARNIMEMSRGWGQFIGPRPAWAEPEASNLRIVRILVLILLAVLLLPYLVTPLYRTGHPVSALMAWRWLKGGAGVPAMGRFQRDFALPAALGGRLRGRQILQPSRGRLGRAAGRDRRCRGRRARPRRLDHYPAGGQEPVPVARPQRGPQGAGTAAGDVDRSGAAQAADPGNLSQYRRARPRPGSSGPRPASMYAFGHPAATLSAREAAPAGGDPAQSRQAQRPPTPGPGGAPPWPGPYGAGQAQCSAAGAEIVPFEPIFGLFNRKPA